MKVKIPSIQPHVRKRLFIGLLGVSLMVVGFLAYALWYLIFNPGESAFNQLLVLTMVFSLSMAVMLSALGMAGILVTLLASRKMGFFQRPIRVALNIFFPVIIGLGRLFKIDVDHIKSSFIEVNNQMVMASRYRLTPDQLLLLAPHCLQRTKCPHKITVEINNCRRCGGCCIGELLELRDRYGVNVGVATGGTLARKYVREYRPRGVVAIACERDLTSGIQDSIPLPVLGVTNERPYGPCHNTYIDITKVEGAIKFFIGEQTGEGGGNYSNRKEQRQGYSADGAKGG